MRMSLILGILCGLAGNLAAASETAAAEAPRPGPERSGQNLRWLHTGQHCCCEALLPFPLRGFLRRRESLVTTASPPNDWHIVCR